MTEVNLLDRYPKSKRPIEERAVVKDSDREVARKFGKEFFDGDRLFGYGGYNYNPRFWSDTVKRFQEYYQLTEESSVLDVGCAKGFMMHDFKRLIPGINIKGVDISEYAVENAIESVRGDIKVADAKELPFDDNSFDLVISINAVHNLPLEECKQAIKEIDRVSRKHAFITMDAWRSDFEKESMLKWNLTALTYMHVEDWKDLFDEIGYAGDYYWFIAVSQ